MIYEKLKGLYYLFDGFIRHNQFLLVLYIRKVLTLLLLILNHDSINSDYNLVLTSACELKAQFGLIHV